VDLGGGELLKFGAGLVGRWCQGVDFVGQVEVAGVVLAFGDRHPVLNLLFRVGVHGQVEADDHAAPVADLLDLPVRTQGHRGLAGLGQADGAGGCLKGLGQFGPDGQQVVDAERVGGEE